MNAEIQKLQMKEVDMTAGLKAMKSQMMEAKDQLLENLRRIEAKKNAISELINPPNASWE